MREGISSVDKDCKLLLLPGNHETKEKKKKKKEKSKQTNGSKKRGHSSTPQNSDDTEKPHPAGLAHDAMPPLPRPPRGSGGQLAKVKGRERRGESGSKRSKKPEDALVTDERPSGGAPPQGAVVELSAQARESLRWEGVLEDPLAEEKRMEVYRANRRQRYLVHRQALLARAKLPVLDQ